MRLRWWLSHGLLTDAGNAVDWGHLIREHGMTFGCEMLALYCTAMGLLGGVALGEMGARYPGGTVALLRFAAKDVWRVLKERV